MKERVASILRLAWSDKITDKQRAFIAAKILNMAIIEKDVGKIFWENLHESDANDLLDCSDHIIPESD